MSAASAIRRVTTMKKSRNNEEAVNAPPLDEVWKQLETRGWLAERAPEVRARLHDIAEVHIYRQGEPLYVVGELARGVFGIARGAVDLAIPREDGQEIVAHRAQVGFWIGDLALFSRQRRLVAVTAATATVAAYLPRTRLAKLIERYPTLLYDFYDLSHRNVATILQLLANLSIPRSEIRVAVRLLLHDQRLATDKEWILLSQEKLAQLTALSLPTIQRTLRHMEDAGLVELGYGRLRILDREGLLAFCG
jgi:CRP-like cAMP-binding protein